LLSVLALLVQGFVTQAHVHQGTSSGVQVAQLDIAHAALGLAGDHHHPPRTPPHGHGSIDHCLLCQSAIAGVGVLPSAPVIILADINTVTITAFEYASSALGALRSHIWRSRAPPLSLHP
jgi:hypothetical protein